MKGYCGHNTHLSVVWDFEILIFCLFIYYLVSLYLVLCWFCKRKIVQSFWRKITFCIFVITIHFQDQQGWGSQKYFWCLDLFTCKFIQKRFLNSSPKIFSLNFECYFSLSIKKMPSVMNKAFTDNELSSTLGIKETEDILGVEYWSLTLEMANINTFNNEEMIPIQFCANIFFWVLVW